MCLKAVNVKVDKDEDQREVQEKTRLCFFSLFVSDVRLAPSAVASHCVPEPSNEAPR